MQDSRLKNFFEQLTSPATLTELLLITAAVLVALAAGHALRSWYRRRGLRTGTAGSRAWSRSARFSAARSWRWCCCSCRAAWSW
jgi:hypothetical protein